MAVALDNDFMKYWQKLNSLEKKSLLAVAQSFIATKSHLAAVVTDGTSQLTNPIHKIEQSDFYTQEQITEMTRNSL